MPWKQIPTLYKQKAEIFLVIRTPIVFDFYERAKQKDESKFATKYAGIVVTTIFI